MTRVVKKSFERRGEILATARRLFQTKEYDEVTMQNVMDTLDIAKGTIYHYFKSKEELFEAVIEQIVDQTVTKMEKYIEKAKGTALEKIQGLIEIGRVAGSEGKILKALNEPRNDTMHTRLLAATLLRQARCHAKLIQQGCDEGVFQTTNPLECAEFVLSGVQFLTDIGIYPWTNEDLQRRIKAFPRLIEQLLKAPRGSFDFMFKAHK